jgi:putative transposase
MKRRYQIEKQRAVNEFRQLAAKENPTVQMMLPMAEIAGLLSKVWDTC